MKANIIVELMEDRFLLTYPYCGEAVEIYLEPEVEGSLVQDCEVCCNPWLVRVVGDAEGRWVEVGRTDGAD
jgi:hypothetical protein